MMSAEQHYFFFTNIYFIIFKNNFRIRSFEVGTGNAVAIKDFVKYVAQKHGIEDEDRVIPKLIAIARKFDIPMVSTNDIHYANQDDAEAQDILVCIGRKKLQAEEHGKMPGGPVYYMKTGKEMEALFPDMPELIQNTAKIASMCNLTIPQYKTQELKDCLPIYEIPPEFASQDDYVRHIVEKGLLMRYGKITPEIRQRAEYELGIIFKMGFSGYFLVVW